MKCLYLTFNNPEHKAGLFYSTHHRIKNAIPLLQGYKILNIQFYDNWFLSFLKIILGIKPRKRSQDSFFFDGLTYSIFWIKRSVFSSVTPWGKFDKWRNSKFFFNEDFLTPQIIKDLKFKSNNFGFIMAHWSYPTGQLAMKVSQASGLPYYMTYHGSDINVLPNRNKFLRKSITEIMNCATLNFMVSKSLIEESKKLSKTAKTVLSPNGIPSNIISNVASTNSNDSLVRIIFIGNLIKIKGADKLPDILKAINEKSNLETHFLIVGSGPLEKSIKGKLSTSNLKFQFLGQKSHEEVLHYLSKSDILILPSVREGLPLVILEALAKRVIPVTSNVGGICEILEPDFIVENGPSFVKNFSNKVVDLSINPRHPKLKIDLFSWENLMRSEIEKIKGTI